MTVPDEIKFRVVGIAENIVMNRKEDDDLQKAASDLLLTLITDLKGQRDGQFDRMVDARAQELVKSRRREKK